jgi:3',5'-cyclic-AMP phosphodiesterase
MPIHLPQLSRREFVKRVALAGAGFALAPGAHAALFGKSRDKHTFALLSDPHIAANAKAVSRNVNMAEHLAAVSRELAGLAKNPAAVLVNGDLALKEGLSGDYATFSTLIDPVRAIAPVHLTLGNHDHRANFWKAFPKEAKAAKIVPDRQVGVIRSSRANWFLLDSLDATDSTPGELGTAQIEWLDRQLGSNRDKPAIVVAHHNLGSQANVTGLKDSAAFEKLFARHSQIKVFIFGHTHNWSVTRHSSGVHLVNLPPVGYVFTAGRPSGWVRASLAPDGMEIELLCLDTKHPEHGQVHQLKWREG